MEEVEIEKIIRSRRRTIALVIHLDATLTVRAPMHAPLSYIRKLVSERRDWISKAKQRILKKGGPEKKKEFIDGEEFLYLGRLHALRIGEYKGVQLGEELYFPKKYLGRARQEMVAWYKENGLEVIAKRAKHYSDRTGLEFTGISMSRAEKRWGSCSSKGEISFSWRLVMAPIHIIDYVVVHELTHILHRNHRKQFWDKVVSMIPDYKERRRWLRDNGSKLMV